MHASLVNGTQLRVNHGTKYKVQFKTIDDQIYTEPPIWPKMGRFFSIFGKYFCDIYHNFLPHNLNTKVF